jgi:hypothetical protein
MLGLIPESPGYTVQHAGTTIFIVVISGPTLFGNWNIDAIACLGDQHIRRFQV